jgi:peptide/nickel transport system substrate-binding protein
MKGPKLRVALILLLAVAMTATLAVGCKRGTPKNTLIYAIEAELDGTDIQQVYTSNIIQTLASPAMVVLDLDNRNVVPQLASSVTLDGNNIVMEFPASLKFTNGKACTGEDIKASIERYIEISPYSSDWAELDHIDVDGQKVTCVFKGPPAYFIAVLTSDYSGIVDVATAEQLGDEAFNRKVVGVGPYKLDEWVQGSHFTFTRFDGHRDFKPFVQNEGPWSFEKVTVRIIPDALTRISELEAGNVDYVSNVPAQFVDRVAANNKLTLLKTPVAGESYLRFNMTKAPFNSYKFRQAINYAVDKEEIKTALDDTVDPVYGLLCPAQLCYSPETEAELKQELAHDQQRSKDLLAELGYSDTDGDGYLDKGGKQLKFTILVTEDVPSHALAAPVIQQQLKEVGINVELQEQGRSYIRELVDANNYDISFARWMWSDPDIWYYSFHESGSNPIWTNDEVSQILDDGRTIMDVAERTAKYAELSRAVAGELCIVSLFYDYNYSAHLKTLTGLHRSVSGETYWNDAVKK